MVFEVGLQLDTPEQCATWYPTHIPAPSDQRSTVLPCGQSWEEMQNIDVSMQKGGKVNCLVVTTRWFMRVNCA